MLKSNLRITIDEVRMKWAITNFNNKLIKNMDGMVHLPQSRIINLKS